MKPPKEDLWAEQKKKQAYKVSIDPSVSAIAMAIWSPEPCVLLWAGYIPISKELNGECDHNFVKVVQSIDFFVSDEGIELMEELRKADTFVVEDPEVYPNNPIPPEDLLTLAKVVGALGLRYDSFGNTFTLMKPKQWKGQTPKDIHNERIKSKLYADELERIEMPAKSYRHNVWDAIGIGLFAFTERGKPKRIIKRKRFVKKRRSP